MPQDGNAGEAKAFHRVPLVDVGVPLSLPVVRSALWVSAIWRFPCLLGLPHPRWKYNGCIDEGLYA